MPFRYNPEKHHRRSIRLKGYDYTAAGAYFITICTHQRECLLGEIVDGEMQLSLLGEIVRSNWMRLPYHHSHFQLDVFVVMPNHFHGIVWLSSTDGRGEAFALEITAEADDINANASPLHGHRFNGTRSGLIGAIVQNFKSVSTRRINQIRKTAGIPIWQRNYYEHIVRDDRVLQYIRQYIQNNPLSWQEDQLHPNNPPKW